MRDIFNPFFLPHFLKLLGPSFILQILAMCQHVFRLSSLSFHSAWHALILMLFDSGTSTRILAFACMVLVLWSPVFVPFLPTLVQSWTTKKPSRTAEIICIIGLYMSIFLLVTLWGKRIRGYEKPLDQYGLDMTSMHKVKVLFVNSQLML